MCVNLSFVVQFHAVFCCISGQCRELHRKESSDQQRELTTGRIEINEFEIKYSADLRRPFFRSQSSVFCFGRSDNKGVLFLMKAEIDCFIFSFEFLALKLFL